VSCMAIVSKVLFGKSSDLNPAGDRFESQLGHKVIVQRLQHGHLNSAVMDVTGTQL